MYSYADRLRAVELYGYDRFAEHADRLAAPKVRFKRCLLRGPEDRLAVRKPI
jgi:hypothetical protein